MWYGFLDGDIAFETKAKSQKVQNLRRDKRLTVMVEDGTAYEELRGVELSGWGEIIDDRDRAVPGGDSASSSATTGPTPTRWRRSSSRC